MSQLDFRGVHDQILHDDTPELSVEGARDSGKSYVCVTKEIRMLKNHPGMKAFLFRFSDKDTQSKLVPFFREMCAHEDLFPEWDNDEMCFNFENKSVAYMFGLRATNASQRYSKLRGLGVARVYCDQTEEVPADIGLEMRAALRQPGFRYQLTYCANPPGEKHWLATQFPLDNRFKNRKLYQLSLYDNAHNLSKDTIRTLEQAFPPEHPKHITLILGRRGVNVTGEPVYGDLYRPATHLKPMAYNPSLKLLEGIDFGRLNPCWVVGQRPYRGGMNWLGGIIALDLFLEDFLPIVKEHRDKWFPDVKPSAFQTCCTLSLSHDAPSPLGIEQLREAKFVPRWKPGSNSPDVVLSLIERQASYLRRGLIAVNDDEARWLKASSDGVEPSPFMAQAYGGGYAWADKSVSVGRNEIKQPQPDDWFEYPMRAAEAIEVNFSVGQKTQEQRDAAAMAARQRAENDSTMPTGPNSWMGWLILFVLHCAGSLYA